jgi:hypothetical protein
MIQAASAAGNAAGLVYFIFDLLHLDGDDVGSRPLMERQARLAALLSGVVPPLHYSDYHCGQGPTFHERACELALELMLAVLPPYDEAHAGLGGVAECHRRASIGLQRPARRHLARRCARRLVMLPERQSSRAGLEAVTRAPGAAIHASRLIFPRRDAMCVA